MAELYDYRIVMNTGVAVTWGLPDHGDPYPDITSDMGMGVTISLSNMKLPQLHITLAAWGSLDMS